MTLPMTRSPALLEPLVPTVSLAQCASLSVAFSRGRVDDDAVWVRRIRRDADLALKRSPYDQAPELRDAVAYVVTELVANALHHGVGDVVMEMRRCEDSLLISVESGAGDQEPIVRATSLTDESGRGLMIVAVLASEWGYTHRGANLRVWARLAASPLEVQR
ncbi:hypothetical protein GCM10010329_78350 [Streptomyces spiroverticillatus]|uniref:Histidine kinase/HSP90-like ATPase domain-containing protein n=1 Tax=Streptomyces finlayi TaxID=67296 RepID=A0A919CEL5_9ACTN|nr:ATP-binding protein [Streptomyces finlayi]GHA43773.1 hypothetical protein GCM10010329_78350 [Streptomyces spiroverticillatus]GHD13184.1 hypothetical protein GCM10010334_71000 [Streptomyces finlayi]